MTKKETLTALEIAKIACNIENDGSYTGTKAISSVPGVAGYRSAVKQFSKSAVRKIRTLRSVAAGGGQPPPATQ